MTHTSKMFSSLKCSLAVTEQFSTKQLSAFQTAVLSPPSPNMYRSQKSSSSQANDSW